MAQSQGRCWLSFRWPTAVPLAEASLQVTAVCTLAIYGCIPISQYIDHMILVCAINIIARHVVGEIAHESDFVDSLRDRLSVSYRTCGRIVCDSHLLYHAMPLEGFVICVGVVMLSCMFLHEANSRKTLRLLVIQIYNNISVSFLF